MPTAAGWKLLALGVAAVVVGRALQILELYVVGAMAVAAVVAALAVRLVHPSRLSVTRRVSSTMVEVFSPVEVGLEFANRSRLSSPTARVCDRLSDGDDARFVLAPVPGRSAASGTYRLQAERRGVIEIGPALVEDVDGLGLARRRSLVGARTRVVVHPVIERLALPRLPVGGDLSVPVDFRRRSLGIESEEFDVLRPYIEGDDLRHIHWRSTARLDELVVRRFQPSRPGRMTVVIDTRPPGDAAEVQDLTASVAGSIVSAVLRGGDEARILTTDGRGTPLLAHRSDMVAALEFLALLDGGGPGLDVETVDGGSVVVVVTASPEAVGDDGARHALARRLQASLIVTRAAGPGDPTSPAADAEGGWIHVTGFGDLPELWPLAALARSPAATRS